MERIAALIAAQPAKEEVKIIETVLEEPPKEEEQIEEPVPEKKEEPVRVEKKQVKPASSSKKPVPQKAAAEEDEEDDDLVGATETAGDPSLMTRYKRSFLAKIIQSDDDVKYFYSELKNSILAYSKVSSQVSWSNDRFTKSRETIAKIGIRGKTLCVFLSLNPDEFASSVYHQTFVGDTKMYEKTPMMVKVKSQTALKRAH